MPPENPLGNPNLLPVRLSPDGGKIVWQDVGDCAFDGAFFAWSLEAWESQHGVGACVETDLASLDAPDLGFPVVEPSLFVFHMARCGSSLLIRALAQSPRAICMSEPPALNDLLLQLSAGDLTRPIAALRILRNFIAALGRRRSPQQRSYAVKFSSWNVLLLGSIRAAFPKVPCLFLYRDPAEVVVSILAAPTGFSWDRQRPLARSLAGVTPEQAAALTPEQFIARCLERMMEAALRDPDVALLDYADLTRDAFARLLQHFAIDAGGDLAAMTALFSSHAKAREGRPAFVSDVEAKQRAVTGAIRGAAAPLVAGPYAALAASPRNLRAIARAETQ